MKKLLHIIATPHGDESRTLQITEAFLENFKTAHPQWVVEELNLAHAPLPSLTLKRVDGKYQLLEGKALFGSLREGWNEIINEINRFTSADAYLITTPMWNFHIPYMLKQYIDIIVQPKYLFRYNEKGEAEGLIKNRKMVVIATYGGTYVTESTKDLNFHEPYLRTIFGFVGITDIDFVVAQPMDLGKEIQQQKIAEARESAKKLANQLKLE